MNYALKSKPRFVRSDNGALAGVCRGLAEQIDTDPLVVRLLWLVSILFFGSGLFLYLFLAFLLPRESQIGAYERPKLLGVCSKIGENYGHEVALIRLLFAASFLFSGGLTLILYLAMFLIIPDDVKLRYYRD